MKRVRILVLCITLILTSFVHSISAFAAGSPIIKCQDVTCNPGDTITVDVTIYSNPGFCYLELTPVYSSQLKLISVDNGNMLDDLTIGNQYIWTSDEDVSSDGVLMTFNFQIGETVSAGDYQVGFTVRNCVNYDENNVEIAALYGTVTVSDTLTGDLTGDTSVDSDDLTALACVVAKIGTPSPAATLAADVTHDGKVDSDDLTKLAKYVAKIIPNLD